MKKILGILLMMLAACSGDPPLPIDSGSDIITITETAVDSQAYVDARDSAVVVDASLDARVQEVAVDVPTDMRAQDTLAADTGAIDSRPADAPMDTPRQ